MSVESRKVALGTSESHSSKIDIYILSVIDFFPIQIGRFYFLSCFRGVERLKNRHNWVIFRFLIHDQS